MRFVPQLAFVAAAGVGISLIGACGDDSGAPAERSGGAGVLAERPAAGEGARVERMDVRIKFKAVLGGEPFACGHSYPGQGSMNTTVTPQDLRLFVQDLALLTTDGTSVPVELEVRSPWQSERVALLDFEDNTGSCVEGNAELNTEITGGVPEGSYAALSFSNGVPEDLNHKDPVAAVDPMKTYASLSWGWLTGFRFIKAELVQEAEPREQFGLGLVHPGAAACSGSAQQGSVTCAKPNRNKIVLEHFDATKNMVVIDVGAIFAHTDLSHDAQCHSSGSSCAPMFAALGIDFATGQAKDGQTLFSVE